MLTAGLLDLINTQTHIPCLLTDMLALSINQTFLQVDLFPSMVESKIYSRTDMFSDRILQRSKHGSNFARSSEQQDILALG